MIKLRKIEGQIIDEVWILKESGNLIRVLKKNESPPIMAGYVGAESVESTI